ncbi:MAG: hypothetical protein H0V30_13345 [Chitinophagaceae bacterium]|nr:hypothetical protein [Chitinophagaceae bacterium]
MSALCQSFVRGEICFAACSSATLQHLFLWGIMKRKHTNILLIIIALVLILIVFLIFEKRLQTIEEIYNP